MQLSHFCAWLCLLHLPESPCIIKVMTLYCLVDCHLVAVATSLGVGSRSSHCHAIIAFSCIVAFVKNSSSSLIVASKKVISCNQCGNISSKQCQNVECQIFLLLPANCLNRWMPAMAMVPTQDLLTSVVDCIIT